MTSMNFKLLNLFQIRRKLKNFEAEQPHTHAIFYLSYLLSEQAWDKSEILDALSGNDCNTTNVENKVYRLSKDVRGVFELHVLCSYTATRFIQTATHKPSFCEENAQSC